jgi:uncharacterized surface protein with fasciclin (FAS1) repeats
MGIPNMALRRQILATAGLALATPAILRAQPSASIPDAMMADGRFASFMELLERSPGLNLLRGAGRFTVFAPTDAGVTTIPATLRAGFTAGPGGSSASAGDAGSLSALVNLHMVDGVHPLSSFTAPSTLLRSRNGTEYFISVTQYYQYLRFHLVICCGKSGDRRRRPAHAAPDLHSWHEGRSDRCGVL